MKSPSVRVIGTICAIVLSGSAAAPARATNINIATLDCQQTDSPQTDLVRTAAGVATLDAVDTPRFVTCSVPRSPLPVELSSGGFWVDGDNRNNASTSCTISSYSYTGVLMGSMSFVAQPFTPSTNWAVYDQMLILPRAQMDYYNYVSMTCLLPAHGNGVLRGVATIQ